MLIQARPLNDRLMNGFATVTANRRPGTLCAWDRASAGLARGYLLRGMPDCTNRAIRKGFYFGMYLGTYTP